MNTENNKLIAEFMDWEIHPTMFQKMQKKGIKQGFRKLSDFVFIKDLAYHSDWNWLMEVVEKIESLDFIFSIHHETANIFNGGCNELKYNETVQARTKKEAVYNACIEFIKWYNLNKNQHE